LFGRDHRERRPPLGERWGERELFFWTAFKGVQLVVAVALAIYLIVCLITGTDPMLRWITFGR